MSEEQQYFDAEGNAVTGILPPDKAQELANAVAEKEQLLKETQEKLAKLENKDFNFKKLRDMTAEEQEKLSDMEKALVERQEKLEEGQKNWTKQVIDSHKADALAVLVGDDADLRKKVEHHYGRIKDEAVTREEVSTKMREAYLLATGGRRQTIDPINRAAGFSSSYAVTSGKKNELNSDQRDLASRLGLTEDDLKKVK